MEDTAIIIHHLRAPIANIKMAVQLLSAKDERNRKYLEVIELECDRQLNLINDLLALERIEDWKFNQQIIFLNFWFNHLIDRHRALLFKRNLKVEIAITGSLTISADPQAIEYIFAELLHNACKYSPPGETIRVTANQRCIAIANRGSIPESQISRIFDAFYRVEGGDPWYQGGSGLGLTLAKKICDRLGYSIAVWCESDWVVFEVGLSAKSSGINQV